MFNNGWMINNVWYIQKKKQGMVYSYNGILLSNEKEKTTDSETTWMNLRNTMLMKNVGYKKYLLYNPTYMKF